MQRYSFDSDENLGAASRSSPPAYLPSQEAYDPPAHSEGALERLRASRRQSQQPSSGIPLRNYNETVSPVSPPVPPPHRDVQGRIWGQELGYTNSMASNVTQGADNFGPQAAGGVTGIALSVADANARQSGLEAERNTPGLGHPYDTHDIYDESHTSRYDQEQYVPSHTRQTDSQSSLVPLGAAAAAPAMSRPRSFIDDPYEDSPYRGISGSRTAGLGALDPNAIEDDGDDGLEYTQHNRRSFLSSTHSSDRGVAAGVAGGAAAGGVIGALGGLVGRSASGNHAAQYGPVHGSQSAYQGYDLGHEGTKSEWLNRETKSNNKWRWILGGLVALLVIGGIVGGVAGYLVSKNKSPKPSSSSTASGDTAANGDLTKDSPEIKALLNNANLHKVFPGIDYTPIKTQYPDCLGDPPSQNNVTRDMAVLSQLSNIVRLYGTDCNQTEMVMHSIDALGLNGTLKVWLGVWQSNNETTNARQLAQMYKILDTYGAASFKGVIVGNEVLFRKEMSVSQLSTILTNVRSNLTGLGYDLPVATSDIGNSWNASLAAASDYVMANVHPFFAGVPVSTAASWTWDYWQNNIYGLKEDLSKNYISETGWPSTGGTDCGDDSITSCANGAVAGVTEMNTFMGDFVCQALTNGTQYFMFEAFDEPWKVIYDSGVQQWEDHWGLMDVDRNLKSGVTIPSCGGKTVPAA